MALTINTQDLELYPGTVKKITVDQDKIVASNNEGDEVFVIVISTSAYSDAVARTAIPSTYLTDMKQGWCKSSGFAGSNGKFAITNSNKYLKVKIDNTTGGDAGFYTIELTPNADGTPVDGEALAADMEAKIRAITLDAEDVGFTLAYRNASVDYYKGKFWVVSGSIGKYYSGNGASAADVQDATASGCADLLGFNLSLSSRALDGVSVREALVTQNYTAGETSLNIGSGTGFAAGDCFMITDNTNKEYFSVVSGTGDTIVHVSSSAIANNYDANVSKVQLLREQDPDGSPNSYISSVDSLVRFGLKNMVNQIDYSA